MFAQWRTIPPGKNTTIQDIAQATIAVRTVVEGTIPLRLICSEGGMGKDHLTRAVCKEMGVKIVHLGAQNIHAFVSELWLNRAAKVFLFSEMDNMFQTAGFANLIKKWTDKGMGRWVTHTTKAVLRNEGYRVDGLPQYDPLTPPPRFQCDAGGIWLSNVNYTLEGNIPDKMKPHWGALKSRGLNPKWVGGKPQEIFEYTMTLALEEDFLRNLQLRLPVSNLVFQTYCKYARRLRDLTPRGLFNLAMEAKDLATDGRLNPENWKERVVANHLQTEERNLVIPVDDKGEVLPWVQILPRSQRPAAQGRAYVVKEPQPQLFRWG